MLWGGEPAFASPSSLWFPPGAPLNQQKSGESMQNLQIEILQGPEEKGKVKESSEPTQASRD